MTETLWQRLVYGVRRLQQRPDWARFAGPDWPQRIMDVAVTDNFHAKQGRSTGRWVLQDGVGRLAVYLKRHYRVEWWRGLLASLWPGRAWSPGLQECRNLEWARAQGLAVPAVVAAGEYVGPWGRLRSFLAIEELIGMVDLHHALPQVAADLEPTTFRRWKRGLIVELARLARELHHRRHFHKDLYLGHFYVPAADTHRGSGPAPDWRGRVHLIDLHRLAHHPLSWRLWQVKDLAQLLFSSEIVGVTPRDRVYFWRLYRGRTRRGAATRLLERCILLKGRRYRRHNDKRARKAALEGSA